MKTKMKQFFAMIVLVFAICGSVNAQNVYYYCGENWENGYTDTVSSHWALNYYHATSISGIAGDTMLMGYKNSSGVFIKVIWVEENPYTFVQTNVDTTKFLYVVIHSDTQNPWTYYIKDTTNCSLSGNADYGPKFIPSILTLSNSNGNKSTTDTLTLSDFNITVDSLAGGFDAYCDSVYWYLDSTLIHAGKDTTYIATVSGNYSIKAKLVYITKFSSDTCRFERFQLSNYITVTIDTITTNVSEFSNDVKLKVYPNPTSDYLYISDEVEYTIYAISGKEVLKGWGNKVDVGDLEPGVYFLRTVDGKETKFIVN